MEILYEETLDLSEKGIFGWSGRFWQVSLQERGSWGQGRGGMCKGNSYFSILPKIWDIIHLLHC